MNNILKANFPEKLGVLFEPHRYKVVFGGRGGGRSWGCARALLLKAITAPIRVLCAREVQQSIRDSVYKLLSDQIQVLGLSSFFEIQEKVIKVKNGGEFTFAGLSTQTIESVKSMEGVDYVWAEEAQTITKRSWDILIPTIRKENSEIWITFNPSLESDETYQRFVLGSPPDAAVVKLNYHDNPWFPDVLEKERQFCKENDPDGYPNIWEGSCKPAIEGAIYYSEIQIAEKEGRICNVPYDPFLRVHVVLDLGWSDSLAAGLVQRNSSEIRIIEYIEASHTKLDIFSHELKTRPYNWGKIWLPHDGYSGSLNSGGKSTKDILKKLGWKVPEKQEITELSVEDGIRNSRMMFRRIYFDTKKCNAAKASTVSTPEFNATPLHNRLLECLKRYRRHINNQTQTALTPVKDDYVHGCFVSGTLVTMEDESTKEIQNVKCGDTVFLGEGISGAVTWAGKVKKSSTVLLEFSDGTKIRCTPSHKFITKKGPVRADALCYSDLYHLNKGAQMRQTNSNCEKRGKWLRNGTGRPKGWPGIKNIMRQIKTSYVKRLKEFAHIAGRNLQADDVGWKRFSAQTNVSHISGKIPGWMTNCGNVAFVVRSFLSTNMLRRKRAVRLVRRRVSQEQKEVYDLTVDQHHVYFANGFLVSNSDMFRYVCVNADKMTNDIDKPRPIRQGYRVLDATVGY